MRGLKQSSPVQIVERDLSFKDTMEKILFIHAFITSEEESNLTVIEQENQNFLITTHSGQYVYFIAESLNTQSHLSSQKFNIWMTSGLCHLLENEV